MIQTVEAVIDEQGKISLFEKVKLSKARRALVTILEDEPRLPAPETALLSEAALAADWDKAKEDEAWSHLQSEQ